MLFSVLHSSSCDYSCFWSNPSSYCPKASPILVLQVLPGSLPLLLPVVGSLHEMVASQSCICKDV